MRPVRHERFVNAVYVIVQLRIVLVLWALVFKVHRSTAQFSRASLSELAITWCRDIGLNLVISCHLCECSFELLWLYSGMDEWSHCIKIKLCFNNLQNKFCDTSEVSKCTEIQCTSNGPSIAKGRWGEFSPKHRNSAGSSISDKARWYGLPWALLWLGYSSFAMAIYVYFSVCIFYRWEIVECTFIFLIYILTRLDAHTNWSFLFFF